MNRALKGAALAAPRRAHEKPALAAEGEASR